MIQNYKARIDALYHIQIAIDDLQRIMMNPSVNSSILLLKESRQQIISEMNEE